MTELRNTINSKAEEAATPPETEPIVQPKGNRKSKGGAIQNILKGTFLEREKVIRLLPFLLYLTCIGLLYIFNSNYANHTIINISKTKKQIEEQRFEYINTKAKLMQTSRQTEIAKKLINSGLKESKIPPRKIVIEQAD